MVFRANRLLGKTMAQRPPPPETLPKYLAEGIPKQDTDELIAIQEWIEELKDYRENISPEEINAADNEEITNIENESDAMIVVKKQNCGKSNCKCQDGHLHGPYKWRVTQSDGGMNWEYIGKA
jgi:hypothetical protein